MQEAQITPIAGPLSRVLDQRTDDELMQLAAVQTPGAFDALVRRYQSRALQVAAKYLGQPVLAQDAAQNAFVEILRGVSRYRARGRFAGYFYRVLLNQCRLAIRRQRCIDRRLAGLSALQPRQPEESAEEALVAFQERERVSTGLRQLSHKLRSVLVLRYAADMSQEEVAAHLDLPVGTVKSRIFNGLRALRSHLEEAR